ncbi:signal peptidase I [Kitasatospora sp. NPDC002227]|uniref:signal peptidase I n=1 Tax=Kitasatospora sp. NPDC002227 TaxID=3154773 RepID=UPI0033177892
MNSELKPGEERESAPGPVAEEGDSGQEPGVVAGESWWSVLRVSVCRTLAVTVTTLMLMPVAALVWGWSPSVVVSGSMKPALSRGDVVVVRPVQMPEVGAGAVISFLDPAHGGRLTTHRAVERLENGGAYRTKGDANRDPDSEFVRSGQLKGVVSAVVPWAGTAWLWLQEGAWARLAVGAALYVLLLRGCLKRPLLDVTG